jgi:hypothetical protein
MQEQMEKWRAIAIEREQALDRAAATVSTLSDAVAALSIETRPPNSDTEGNLSFVVWPRPTELANIPAHVRDAAQSALKKGSVSTPRRWWEGRR